MTKKSNNSAVAIPSVLAFERKMDCSDAVFFQADSAHSELKCKDLNIREKSVRGTISNRLENTIANDPVKVDAEIEKANLQTVDVAMLDEDCDTLVVRFSLKILPFDGKPNVCNESEFQRKLLETVETYIAEQGLKKLSSRYAANIANARWLWRNRVGAESIQITVRNQQETVEIKDAKAFSLIEFDEQDQQIAKIAQWIEEGLRGKKFVLLTIEARAKVGYGQEVFPSQELLLDMGKNKKSKVLYAINGKAGMHNQKIGNALRTVDNWYPDAEFPIAAEPYGAVTTLGTAFRQPKQKMDFYTLFDNWLTKNEVPAVEQQHYIAAVLIRGGVFGASGKE